MMTSQPEVAWTIAAELGEGPVWVERDRALWFVDIKKQLVHRFDPANAERHSWRAPEQIGFLFPAERGGFVAGLKSGLFHFDPAGGEFELIARVDADNTGNRLNDGVVDPSGRLWFGTMDDAERAKSGAFYCFAAGAVRHTGIGGIAITNGPAVSPEGRILYFVDTLRGTIEAAEIRGDGTLGERRPFVRIDPSEGHPDGPTVDSAGCVWIALYGGWEARRYSPAGELMDRVRFPVSNVTKIAFGGADLKIAFATTARQQMKPEQIAEQPQVGDLFSFEADVAGMRCPLVRF